MTREIKSAITISLVNEARGGPFVFWDDIDEGCRSAKALGFDAVEVFPPGPDAAIFDAVRTAVKKYDLRVAAVGTGAGWVRSKLTLTSSDAEFRVRAMEFIRSIIDFAGQLQAPAIIGSMQGRANNPDDQGLCIDHLTNALNELGSHAAKVHVPLLIEPLNRYETNLINTVDGGVRIIESLRTKNVGLLVDLFHMNIEEANIVKALRRGGRHIKHVHFVDSNRRAAGYGHLNYQPIADTLREIGYTGYVSAEALPAPDSMSAAQQTIDKYRELFQGG
jgi:sugar phosphate isomerase/epimerase